MAACTFKGASDVFTPVKQDLISLLDDLITNHYVDTFYVGNEGLFDALVHWVLYDLKLHRYPHIQYAIVLAYPPLHFSGVDYSDTIFPEELRSISMKDAIQTRDDWMLERSDYIVIYTV